MTVRCTSSTIESAVARLRSEALGRPEGALLGSEDALQSMLGVSRPTVRQVARLLEREGLLRVKRGNNGGYFVARPDPELIEAAMSTYLEVLAASPDDLTTIATALWVELVRKAATLENEAARGLARRFGELVANLPDGAGFDQVLEIEQQVRRAVFDLVDAPYVELLFNVNANFARRRLDHLPSADNATAAHAEFVERWRKAKFMELNAISDGDPDPATLYARRARDLLQCRLSKFG